MICVERVVCPFSLFENLIKTEVQISGDFFLVFAIVCNESSAAEYIPHSELVPTAFQFIDECQCH